MKKLLSGKNISALYYAASYLRLARPRFYLNWKRKHLLGGLEKRKDYDYIMDRVDYYCRLGDLSAEEKSLLREKQHPVCEDKILHPKVYYLDSMRYTKYFPAQKRWCYCFGDVTHIPDVPSIVKSRPICYEGEDASLNTSLHNTGDLQGIVDNRNSVIMKLERMRHFVFLDDSKPWGDKLDKVIFRGAIGQNGNAKNFKRHRYVFMERYFDHPMCDLGEVKEGGAYVNEAWLKPKITLYDHLNYKFIMSLEGNDVASNLKWVMSSNSIAVMPRPKYETWFMEGRLIPNYHYIQIKDDYSDLEERLTYFINHPDEAAAIIEHAHEWVDQFRDSGRETIISLLVLDKYFRCTQ